jgi:hypothetical protein
MTSKSTVIHVLVLSSEGCDNTLPTILLIEKTARELNLPIKLETLLIETQDQAERNRFPGSPTVQINGIDIDPAMRNNTSFGFT